MTVEQNRRRLLAEEAGRLAYRAIVLTKRASKHHERPVEARRLEHARAMVLSAIGRVDEALA